MDKPIQIFKPGKHTAMSGQAFAFSESDLAATVAAYDPAKHEAPLVVGHPKHDDPAYGWVKSLAFADGLEAEPHQVNPDFAEMVGSGAFKKISASFYAPDSPSNPVPGVYYLRHVGFLGAQPPAVKGLRAPEFADAEQGVVEFSEWDDITSASLWRRMREWFIGKFGQEEADKVIPSWDVQALEQSSQRELDESMKEEPNAVAGVPASFSEKGATVTPEEKAALEAENARLKTELEASVARDKAARVAARHADHAAFAEGLVNEGKLLPGSKVVTVATLDFMAAQEEIVEFGEGDAKKPLLDAYKASLLASPKLVEFGEVAGAAADTALDANDAVAVAAKAVEFQEAEAKAGRTVSVTDAVNHVTKGSK